MESQVLHTVWCHISGEAAGEIWTWSGPWPHVSWTHDFHSQRCKICRRRKRDSEPLLLCDDCNLGFHMHCLRPALTAVPEGSWSCVACKVINYLITIAEVLLSLRLSTGYLHLPVFLFVALRSLVFGFLFSAPGSRSARSPWERQWRR